MHPVTTSRLAFSLPARTGESSFPERHVDPDDMAHLHDHEPAFDQHQLHHDEPGFPKLGLAAPGMSAFWQHNWLEQYHQPPPHHQDAARHGRQHHHAHSDHWVDDTTCFSPTSPPDILRIPSPQTNNGAPQFSPLPASAHEDTTAATAPTEWDALLSTAHLDFPWLPTQADRRRRRVKSEDDSDSAWSVNSDDIPTPPTPATAEQQRPYPPAASRPQPRRRLGSAPRVTKISKTAGQGGGAYHTFRMSKRPPAASPPVTIDFTEATPFGMSPITNYGAANDANSTDPAKMLEKRIAHKLSEKSRRNRLTSAIREIQRLMPLDAVAAAVEVEGQKGEVVYPHFSKVDVVEMAIGYIKRLQKENEEMKKGAGRSIEDGGGNRDASEGRDESAGTTPGLTGGSTD